MSTRGAPPDPRRREVIKWLWRVPVIAVAAGGGYGLYEAIKVHFLKRSAAAEPTFDEVTPTRVAAPGEFAEVWDGVPFTLPTPAGGTIPALVVRLPGPIPGDLALSTAVAGPSAYLAGFSRVCTHQHCTVVLNRDIDAINFGFNYLTDAPALTCPCHLSVFDPMRGGKAVSGPAVLPLPRVRLELLDGVVFATGLERT